MYSRIFLSAVVVSVLNTFSGCATQDVAAPGISSKEMNVLVSNYYYQVVPHEQRYTSEQLNELFRASDNPTLDGGQPSYRPLALQSRSLRLAMSVSLKLCLIIPQASSKL